MPEYKRLPLGFERAVLEICEKTNLKDKLKYFESLEFQKAMLASAFWFGRKIRLMPFLSIDRKSRLSGELAVFLVSQLNISWLINGPLKFLSSSIAIK